jgi:hypothetical protein
VAKCRIHKGVCCARPGCAVVLLLCCCASAWLQAVSHQVTPSHCQAGARLLRLARLSGRCAGCPDRPVRPAIVSPVTSCCCAVVPVAGCFRPVEPGRARGEKPPKPVC